MAMSKTVKGLKSHRVAVIYCSTKNPKIKNNKKIRQQTQTVNQRQNRQISEVRFINYSRL